jgi:hypothetical protein
VRDADGLPDELQWIDTDVDGSSLKPHVHFHCCVTDCLFSAEARGGVKFHGIEAITEEDLQRIQQTLRRRLIGLFKRRGPGPLELLPGFWVCRATTGFSFPKTL